MTKERKLKTKLESVLDKDNGTLGVYTHLRAVQRPNGFVQVRFIPSDNPNRQIVAGSGWSKVMWPDEFTYERAIEIATGKATLDLARAMIEAGFDVDDVQDAEDNQCQ